MSGKHKNNIIYAVLSLNDFNITLYTTKTMAAEKIGCHRNTLQNVFTRTTMGDYVLFPITLTKCNRGKR